MAVNFAEGSGARICWEESGEGEPLLLIMGATFSRHMWHRVAPVLATQHRVIWYDNRGFGDSAATTTPYSVSDLAADAASVLDAAKVESAHVYGVSMGGLVAQELALAHPRRVRSLILGCTWAAAADRRPARWVRDIRSLIPPALLLGMSKPLLYGPGALKDEIAEDMRLIREHIPQRSELKAQTDAAYSYVSRERLRTLQLPTLVLHGTRDRVIPYKWGAELAAHVPGANFHALKDAGHNYITDAAAESNAAVLTFLALQAS